MTDPAPNQAQKKAPPIVSSGELKMQWLETPFIDLQIARVFGPLNRVEDFRKKFREMYAHEGDKTKLSSVMGVAEGLVSFLLFRWVD